MKKRIGGKDVRGDILLITKEFVKRKSNLSIKREQSEGN